MTSSSQISVEIARRFQTFGARIMFPGYWLLLASLLTVSAVNNNGDAGSLDGLSGRPFVNREQPGCIRVGTSDLRSFLLIKSY